MLDVMLTPNQKLEKQKASLLTYIESLDDNRIDLVLATVDIAFNLGQLDGAAAAKKIMMQAITK